MKSVSAATSPACMAIFLRSRMSCAAATRAPGTNLRSCRRKRFCSADVEGDASEISHSRAPQNSGSCPKAMSLQGPKPKSGRSSATARNWERSQGVYERDQRFSAVDSQRELLHEPSGSPARPGKHNSCEE